MNCMNKVYFLIGAIPPQTGGELYNYKLLKFLEREGYDTELISLHKRLTVRLSLIPLFGNLLANIALVCLLYKTTGILIEDHYFTKYLLLKNVIQRFLKKEKIILIVHSLYGYDSNDKFFLKKWLNGIKHKTRLSLADLIITNSEYSKREIVSLGIKSALVIVIPPGIDREKLQIIPQYEKTESDQILCVANYLPGKGLIYLIEAFYQINRRNFTLHLVGNPKKSSKYFNNMKTTVEKLNLTKDVYFHDGTDRENLQNLYSQANIFVLPTLKETFGIVLIEAMHYGLPIITTKVGAIPDLVIDGENGLLVPPSNSQALAEALSKLVENPELRKKIGNKNRQNVASFYYWEQSFCQFKSAVESIT